MFIRFFVINIKGFPFTDRKGKIFLPPISLCSSKWGSLFSPANGKSVSGHYKKGYFSFPGSSRHLPAQS